MAYPWSEESEGGRWRLSEPENPEELPALIERLWPALAVGTEPQRAPSPRADFPAPEAHRSAPWPDLPEPPAAESAEAGALLRQWERLSRLDREQRGE